MKQEVPSVYHLIPSPLGHVGIVRRNDGGRFLIQEILLPRKGRSMDQIIQDAFPGVVRERGGGSTICAQIRAFLDGDAVDFEIGELDFTGVGAFARRVLMANREIPRGRVMTYGGIAAKLGRPGGARAVGNAQAGNPFPLVIPCHRVVRSGGSLGGFGGGLPMKRTLLAMEGVLFDKEGRVLPEHILSAPGDHP